MNLNQTPTVINDRTVFTALVVEHRHGTNVSVHPDTDAARRALLDYVTDWWADECPNESQPDDAKEAIETYFDAASGESYSITDAAYSA